jgi:hypothetical protein
MVEIWVLEIRKMLEEFRQISHLRKWEDDMDIMDVEIIERGIESENGIEIHHHIHVNSKHKFRYHLLLLLQCLLVVEQGDEKLSGAAWRKLEKQRTIIVE